jgi:hypothetical protein
MKNILFLLCISFGISLSSQTERDQKIQKRVERDNPSSSTIRPPVVTPSPYYGPGRFPYQPYYGPYRPWYNNRYYRNSFYYGSVPVVASRSRVARENDPVFGFGLVSSIIADAPSTVGVRMLIGGKYVYLFGNYQFSKMNPHSHFDNITLVDVINWNDQYQESVTTNVSWDLGVGMRINKIVYPTVSIGNNKVREYLVYFDETGVLSPNGLYSINGRDKQIFSLTTGVDFHVNKYLIINTGFGVGGPSRLVIGGQIKFQ